MGRVDPRSAQDRGTATGTPKAASKRRESVERRRETADRSWHMSGGRVTADLGVIDQDSRMQTPGRSIRDHCVSARLSVWQPHKFRDEHRLASSRRESDPLMNRMIRSRVGQRRLGEQRGQAPRPERGRSRRGRRVRPPWRWRTSSEPATSRKFTGDREVQIVLRERCPRDVDRPVRKIVFAGYRDPPQPAAIRLRPQKPGDLVGAVQHFRWWLC